MLPIGIATQVPHQALRVPEVVGKRGFVHEVALRRWPRFSFVDGETPLVPTAILGDELIASAGKHALARSMHAGVVVVAVELATWLKYTHVFAACLSVGTAVVDDAVVAARVLRSILELLEMPGLVILGRNPADGVVAGANEPAACLLWTSCCNVVIPHRCE